MTTLKTILLLAIFGAAGVALYGQLASTKACEAAGGAAVRGQWSLGTVCIDKRYVLELP